MNLFQTQKLLADQFKYPDDDVILHLDKKPKRQSFPSKTTKSPKKIKKELLLDRGLILCLKVNEIVEEIQINIDEVLNFKKEQKIEVDLKLLDENYWMNQKVDKYARTEQRKVIPQERWFMLKDNSFTPNLMKCFELNRNKFIDTYNWLNSLEKK